MSDYRLAVSFGASFLGFPTHLGFLRGLVAGGWKPHAVAGSSAGALVAGLYAAGLSLDAMEAAFTRPDLKRHFRERSFVPRVLGTFLGVRGVPAVLHGHKIERLLRDLVGDRRIEDCPAARLHLAVTNFRTHSVELRDSGPLVETILASCALPGFLTPRRMEGELLWDGGLGSVVPVEQWIDDPDITHLATHNLLHEEMVQARAEPARLSFPAAMFAGHQLTSDELLRWKLEIARRNGKVIAAIETVTPRPRIGLPITGPARRPWPEEARALLALGERSAQTALARFVSVAGTPAASY
jgi:NTE family protein